VNYDHDLVLPREREAAGGGGAQVSFGLEMLRSICCGSDEENRLV
jgi:hypothetical protein